MLGALSPEITAGCGGRRVLGLRVASSKSLLLGLDGVVGVLSPSGVICLVSDTRQLLLL